MAIIRDTLRPELERIKTELKALQAKTTDDMHKRLNGITVKLNEMSGTLTLMIDILKTRKSL